MPSLCRLFRIAHVWLLAVLMLASGLPHRQCVCPDGQVKWFCLRPANDPSCCCNSACCAACGATEDTPPTAAPCCCCRHPHQGAAGGLRETPCRKSWQPSSVVADRRAREPSLTTTPEAPALLTPVGVDTVCVPGALCAIIRQTNRPPPSLDRNLLFQRLLL